MDLAGEVWPGAGAPLLLLHGLASTRHIWDVAIPLIVGPLPVLAFDQRGHGESGKPGRGYRFSSLAADALAMADAARLPRPLVVVGHSWGANVALALGTLHPQQVAALVLVDGGLTNLQDSGMSWEDAERRMAPPDLTRFTREQLVAMVRRGRLGEVWSPAVEASVNALVEDLSDGHIRARFPRADHMLALRALWEQRPAELLRGVRVPVLAVMAGADGGSWVDSKRRAVERAQAVAPSLEVRWFDDAVHDIPLHRPRRLAEEMLGFLRRHPLAPPEAGDTAQGAG